MLNITTKFFGVTLALLCLISTVQATENPLKNLKNYHVDTDHMVSSGLPEREHFEHFKTIGIEHVIDLIPDDRSDEIELMKRLSLNYHNIAVEWQNPTVTNFRDYVAAMKQSESKGGIILTHCRLNWRGAVFTYLYRVTQLRHDEKEARQTMHEIWEPNDVWQTFIDNVLSNYQKNTN